MSCLSRFGVVPSLRVRVIMVASAPIASGVQVLSRSPAVPQTAHGVLPERFCVAFC